MGRFSDLLNKVTDTTVKPGEEDEMASNPRNALADTVNPYLEKVGLPGVPKMTVADDKNYFANLPEQMAGATMGSVGAIENTAGKAASRFGKILGQAEPEAMALGKVTVKPSAAEIVSDVNKMGPQKMMTAENVSANVADTYGAALAKAKGDMQKGLITPDAYQALKQELTNKVRFGLGQ